VRRKVIRDCVTLGAAVGASGLSFGAVSVAAGLSTPQACTLSLLVFSGGSQFALVGVLGAGGSAAAGIAGASLLGVRRALLAAAAVPVTPVGVPVIVAAAAILPAVVRR